MAGQDIAMNQFQIVTGAPYIYVELADGSQGKIKKSDLANIMAGLINPICTSKSLISPDGWNFRTAIENGIYSIVDAKLETRDNPGISHGVLIVARTTLEYVAQIAIDVNGTMYSRFCNIPSKIYGEWVQ